MLFSVPLNPKLNESQFEFFLNFLKEYKDWIYDIYFTCRIPPFSQDAMGDVISSDEDAVFAIETALFLQEETGIPVSATFNNIEVRPDQNNLELFIEEFRPIYDAGVRSATIPHTHWVSTGQIQKEFPELMIKNTILRNVSEPREIALLAESGFDYINIDRDLMRDYDKLLRIKKAKEKYGVKIALLANEGCAGGCIMMDEHYQFNNTRTDGPQYFNDPISRVSCPMWNAQDASAYLKVANLTPWREDWEELRSDYGIDVFKMHGREFVPRLFETMALIKRYAAGEIYLYDTFQPYIEETNMADKPIDVWRKKIRTCKFDCWDCGFCDKIYESRYGKKPNKLVTLVTQQLVDSVNNTVDVNVSGLTSPKVQSLINSLAKECDVYLEVGSYLGATACAAIKDNNIEAHFVDNWEDPEMSPMTKDATPQNSKEEFMKNILSCSGSNSINVHHSDMLEVDTTAINGVELFFYDGPHEHEAVSSAVQYYKDSLAEASIIIFDDANWEGVVSGAQEGIVKSGLNIIYSKLMLNEIESERNWWNGLYIVVVAK